MLNLMSLEYSRQKLLPQVYIGERFPLSFWEMYFLRKMFLVKK